MISKTMVCAVVVFSMTFACFAVDEPKPQANNTEQSKKATSDSDSSWFSWMWPFGSSGKTESETAKKQNAAKPQLDVVEVKADNNAVAKTAEKPVANVAEPKIADEKSTEATSSSDDSGFGRVLLLYFPNVLLDLSDIFTLGLSVGSRAGAEVRLTRWCQVGGTYGEDYFVEKAFDRQVGGGYEDRMAFQLASLVDESSYVDAPFGTVKEYILNESKARVLSPDDELYATKVRDFWAIGAAAGWLVNVKAYIHPVEVADFVLGLFFIDFRDDNIK